MYWAEDVYGLGFTNLTAVDVAKSFAIVDTNAGCCEAPVTATVAEPLPATLTVPSIDLWKPATAVAVICADLLRMLLPWTVIACPLLGKLPSPRQPLSSM